MKLLLITKRKYNLLIGERTSEQIKITIGTAYPKMRLEPYVKGRDLVAGIPKTIEIASEEIRETISEPVNTIVEAVRVAQNPARTCCRHC